MQLAGWAKAATKDARHSADRLVALGVFEQSKSEPDTYRQRHASGPVLAPGALIGSDSASSVVNSSESPNGSGGDA
jgi:hypothetical protein